MKTIFLKVDIGLFIGSLHPLVVHLPIGFLILAGLFFFLSRNSKYSFLEKALPVTLFLSALSAVAACILGWLLASEGGYLEDTLFWHRWMGVGVAIFSTLAWAWSVRAMQLLKPSTSAIVGGEGQSKLPVWLVGIILILVMITGHYGGVLTHGENYLTNYAPEFLQSIFGAEDDHDSVWGFPEIPDSVRIYEHVIQPVLKQKCESCHNANKKKGNLVLTTKEGLIEGGDTGPVVVKGASMESELLRRVTLNPTSTKFMPPSGVPMSYREIKLLDYWIASGLSFELSITDTMLSAEIKSLLEQEYGLSDQRKSYTEIKHVEPAPAENIASLREQGFIVQYLARDNNFLEVSTTQSMTKDKMEALLQIKEQLTWLSLNNTKMQNDWMFYLGEFPNLTKLRLEQNPITSEGLGGLTNLEHLEFLNLYGTQIDDQGLESLEKLKKLQKLYLWQTKVTPESVEDLQIKIPGLVVDLGL